MTKDAVRFIDYRLKNKEIVVRIGSNTSKTTPITFAPGDALLYNPLQRLYPISIIPKLSKTNTYLRIYPKDFVPMMMLIADIENRYKELRNQTYYSLICIAESILYIWSQNQRDNGHLLDFFRNYVISNYTPIDEEFILHV